MWSQKRFDTSYIFDIQYSTEPKYIKIPQYQYEIYEVQKISEHGCEELQETGFGSSAKIYSDVKIDLEQGQQLIRSSYKILSC